MNEQTILSSLGELAALAAAEEDLDQTAESIVALACETLGCRYAGLTVFGTGGTFETLAPTDPLVLEADHLQYDLREGPCVEAAWEETTFLSRDLVSDPRWPSWGPKAAALGFRSMLAARLTIGEQTVGALNLYATEVRDYDEDDRETAVVFATHAAATLVSVRERETLKEAVAGRTLIGQAQGILMARFELDADRAFAVLRRYSQAQNVKLRTVAELVVASGELPPVAD